MIPPRSGIDRDIPRDPASLTRAGSLLVVIGASSPNQSPVERHNDLPFVHAIFCHTRGENSGFRFRYYRLGPKVQSACARKGEARPLLVSKKIHIKRMQCGAATRGTTGDEPSCEEFAQMSVGGFGGVGGC